MFTFGHVNQLVAPMPLSSNHSGDPPSYSYSQQSIDRFHLATPTFYSTHDSSHLMASPNSPQDSGDDVRWKWQMTPQSGGFVDWLGMYYSGWNSIPPPDQRMGSMYVSGSMSLGMLPANRHGLLRTPVPSNPRGPPRKPRRSGYALWVGNLPPLARIEELKDHFSSGATEDIESVFLISKTNCAFVNYSTEGSCIAAMNRFHNSRFHGRSLVCRLRRTASSSSTSTLPVTASGLPHSTAQSPSDPISPGFDDPPSPLIVGRQTSQNDPFAVASPVKDTTKLAIPAKYFILKSLTLEDLEASVVTRFWATQAHNEDDLNKAFAEADDVFLIFSANKSGEFFGYARMASAISGTAPETLPNASKAVPQDNSSDFPRAIHTPATATAPKGLIIDDSARGSVFWEADRSDVTKGSRHKEGKGGERNGNRQFAVEWVSTAKIPFYQARGIRNPWNGNKEIKIARDGQELDPRVGRRLLQLFRASPDVVRVDSAHSSSDK